MNVLQAMFFAIMVGEFAASASWNRLYFSYGIPIFKRTIPAHSTEYLPLDRLEDALRSKRWVPLLFHPLSETRCAFRERHLVFPLLRITYFPIMRGAIVIDTDGSSVRVLGLCNWAPLWVAFVIMVSADVAAELMVVMAMLFGMSYMLQRARFNQVAEAITELANKSIEPTS